MHFDTRTLGQSYVGDPRFIVALVIYDWVIVTSLFRNCDVFSCPAVMRRYVIADGEETVVENVSFLCFLHGDRGRIEIDQLYGLLCRGWYCYPTQHSL